MKSRIRALQQSLSGMTQAFLITSDVNRFYFTGFSSSAGGLLITKSQAYLLVDFRYGESAKNTVKHCKVIVYSRFFEALEAVCREDHITEIGVENSNVTLAQAKNYKNFFAKFGVSLAKNCVLDAVIENQRLVKSANEVSMIKQAQKITEEAYLEVLNCVKPGITEREIALELEYLMRKKGADGASFKLITITGKKTSLPHGEPDNSVIKEGDFFLSDIGALYKGYHSDMTRTVAVKNYTDEMAEIYNIVLNAQLSALKAVKAGVKASLVDKTARDVITHAGYGSYFGHSTGHGVGLDIHELPTVSTGGEAILSDNMVITVEPGIYMPNKFGIRIEDMILVTQNGYENFTTIDKTLTIV